MLGGSRSCSSAYFAFVQGLVGIVAVVRGWRRRRRPDARKHDRTRIRDAVDDGVAEQRELIWTKTIATRDHARDADTLTNARFPDRPRHARSSPVSSMGRIGGITWR
jgi:hypothetical protein